MAVSKPQDDSGGQSSGGKTWRSKSHAGRTSTGAIQHRWQAPGEFTHQRMQRRSWGRRLLMGGMLATTIISLALFGYLVLFAPQKTPLLTMVALDYSWPYEPNSWAEEDQSRLHALDGRSITIYPVGHDEMRRNEWLAELNRQLSNAGSSTRNTQPCLIYISMHGSVDSAGVPCLIPPNSSPTDSSTWIPVPDILSAVQRQRPTQRRPIVIFFDCNKTLANWDQALIYNSFAARLADLINERNIPHLHVINSTSPGEQALTSGTLRGSVFGRSLAQALAGAADQSPLGGNSDRILQLGELFRFVKNRVANWAGQCRGRQQTPTVIPDHSTNLKVCWAIRDFDALTLAETNPDKLNSATALLYENWQRYEELPNAQLLRTAPIAAARFSQQLAWCEQALTGGRFYLPRVESKLLKLKQELVALDKQLKPDSEYAANTQWGVEPGPLGHTFALNQFFGRADQTYAAGQQRLTQLAENYSPKLFEQLLAESHPQWEHFADLRFLTILRQMGTAQTWQNQALMSAMMSAQQVCRTTVTTADLRLIDRIKQSWKSIQKRRRDLEDQTLVGTAQAGDWTQLQTDAEALNTYYHMLSENLALVDRGYLEIPLYARWLADPAQDQQRFVGHVKLIESVLLPAFENHRLLGKLLDGTTSESLELDQARIDSAAQTLKESLDKLRTQYASEVVSKTVEITWKLEDLNANQAALRIPLLEPTDSDSLLSGAQQRQALFELTARMRKHFDAATIDLTKTESTAATSTQGILSQPIDQQASADDALRSLLGTTSTLIRDLIANDGGDSEFSQAANTERSIVKLEGFFRSRLESYQESNRLMMEQAQLRGENSRSLLAQASNQSRRLATYWRPGSHSQAVEQLRRFDAARFVLFQLQTVLDDFLGGENSIEPPFFQQAGAMYQTYVQHVEAKDVELMLDLKRLTRLQAERVAAATDGLKLSSARNLVIDGSLVTPISIKLTTSPAATPPGMPALTGQFVLNGANGQRLDAQAASVDLATDSADSWLTKFDVTAQQFKSTALPKSMSAEFQFRGHQVQIPVPLTEPRGQSARIDASSADSASVTVLDRTGQSAAVMLILDCSQSMAKTIRWEASGTELSKFDAALIATNRILSSLANRTDSQSGLILYGHRVGWNTNDPTQIVRQTDYLNAIPEPLFPYEDEETVLSFGRFGPAELNQVNRILKTVKPWGETPLYLSIQTALDELKTKAPGKKTQIIVITDGINKQLNPSADKYVSLNSLLAADFDQTELNIIGFGIEATDAASASRQFDQLATRTGGEYVAINDAGRLLKKLSDYFRKQTFSVTSGGKSDTQPAGSPTRLKLEDGVRQTADVKFGAETARLNVSAGDDYQLVVGPKADTLESVRYLQRSPVFAPLKGPDADDQFELGLHRPTLQQGTLEIELSLQSRKRLPVSRPNAFMISLTPLVENRLRTDLTYRIAGARFVSNKPVPVVSVQAANWPDTADALQVTASILLDQAGPARATVSLAELQSSKTFGLLDYQISPNDPNVLLVVRNESSAGLLVTNGQSLLSNQTQFDPTEGLLIHRFGFSVPLSEKQLPSLKLITLTEKSAGWVNNRSAPLTAPISVETSLKPRSGPILVQ